MAISADLKSALNELARTNVALNDDFSPYPSSIFQLGDALSEMNTNARQVVGRYSFDRQGGAIGSYESGIILPEDAIVTRVYTRMLTVFASGGLAEVALSVAAQPLKAATAFNDASYTGVVDQSQAGTNPASVPLLVSADNSALTVDISTAALTDGDMLIFVDYFKPELP